MLEASRNRILRERSEEDLVLDVGGWAHPLARADWVLDLMPFETRGLYGEADPEPERFSRDTWVVRDICDREPWPFGDDQFDYVVCSHTLEDVRDPVWVCSELTRVAKAGYVEVPARVEEQTRGVHGDWVGWSHHHWLVDIEESHIQFVLKPHLLHGRPEFCISLAYTETLVPEQRISQLFWSGTFTFAEKVFFDPDDLHSFLRKEVERAGNGAELRIADKPPGRVRRVLGRMS